MPPSNKVAVFGLSKFGIFLRRKFVASLTASSIGLQKSSVQGIVLLGQVLDVTWRRKSSNQILRKFIVLPF